MLSPTLPMTQTQPPSSLWYPVDTEQSVTDIDPSNIKKHHRSSSHRGPWSDLPSSHTSIRQSKILRRHSDSDFDRSKKTHCSFYRTRALKQIPEMASNNSNSDSQKLEKMNQRINDLHNMNILMPPKPIRPSGLKVKDDISIKSSDSLGIENMNMSGDARSNKRRCSIGNTFSPNDTFPSVLGTSPVDLDPKLIAVLGPHGTSALLSSSPVRRRSVDFANVGNEDEFTAVLRLISSNASNSSPAGTPSSNKLFAPPSKESSPNQVKISTDSVINRVDDQNANDEQDNQLFLPCISESVAATTESGGIADTSSTEQVLNMPRPTSLFENNPNITSPRQKSKLHLRNKFSKTLSIKNEEEEFDFSDDDFSTLRKHINVKSEFITLETPKFDPRSLSPIYQSSNSGSNSPIPLNDDENVDSGTIEVDPIKSEFIDDVNNAYITGEPYMNYLINQVSGNKQRCSERPTGEEPASATSSATQFDPAAEVLCQGSQNLECFPTKYIRSEASCENSEDDFDCVKEQQFLERHDNLLKSEELVKKEKESLTSESNIYSRENIREINNYKRSTYGDNETVLAILQHTNTKFTSQEMENISQTSFYLVTNVLGNFILDRCFFSRKYISNTESIRFNVPSKNIEPQMFDSCKSDLKMNIKNESMDSIASSLETIGKKTYTDESTISNSEVSSASEGVVAKESCPDKCPRRPSHNSIRATLQYMRRQDALGFLLLVLAFLPFALLAVTLDVSVKIFCLILKVISTTERYSYSAAVAY